MSKAMLTIICGTEKRHVEIDADAVVVGRSDCDIQLDDAKVSKRHARIHLADGRFEVEDLDSRNGTFLNGAKIQRARLGDGDRLRLGNSSLFFHTEQFSASGVTFVDSPTGKKNIVLDALRKEILTSELDERSVLLLKRAQSDLAAIYRAGQIISSILCISELHPQDHGDRLQRDPRRRLLLLAHHRRGHRGARVHVQPPPQQGQPRPQRRLQPERFELRAHGDEGGAVPRRPGPTTASSRPPA